eukprot:3832037-Prymnesium_polylepis.1
MKVVPGNTTLWCLAHWCEHVERNEHTENAQRYGVWAEMLTTDSHFIPVEDEHGTTSYSNIRCAICETATGIVCVIKGNGTRCHLSNLSSHVGSQTHARHARAADLAPVLPLMLIFMKRKSVAGNALGFVPGAGLRFLDYKKAPPEQLLAEQQSVALARRPAGSRVTFEDTTLSSQELTEHAPEESAVAAAPSSSSSSAVASSALAAAAPRCPCRGVYRGIRYRALAACLKDGPTQKIGAKERADEPMAYFCVLDENSSIGIVHANGCSPLTPCEHSTTHTLSKEMVNQRADRASLSLAKVEMLDSLLQGVPPDSVWTKIVTTTGGKKDKEKFTAVLKKPEAEQITDLVAVVRGASSHQASYTPAHAARLELVLERHKSFELVQKHDDVGVLAPMVKKFIGKCASDGTDGKAMASILQAYVSGGDQLKTQ